MDRRTLVEHLYSWARQQPDKTAIVHNNTPHSYADFVRAIAVTRDRLAGSAGPPGSTAILLASDLFQSWCATLALQSLGLRTISVRSLDQAAVLRVDNCACVVASAADGSADGVGQYEWPGAKVVALPSDLYLGIRSGDLPAPPEGSPRFANHILYTSGTTGSYKKLVLDCASDEDRFATLARHYEITHGSVFHASRFGLWTAVGYAMAAAAWLVGGSVITDQRTDYLDGLFRHGATCVFLLPPDLSALLDSRAADAARLAGVEVLTAGGFLPPNVAEEFSHRVADVTVAYGSTECLSVMKRRIATREDAIWLTPYVDRAVEIVDDTGQICAVGQEGEMRIRTKAFDSHAYLDDGETSARVFRDGCFYPGDLAVRRADGRIRVLGRVADVLNFQGQKIAAGPIELAIQQRLGVEEVCLFSGLTDDGKERLAIVIQCPNVVPSTELDAITREFPSFGEVRTLVLRQFPRTTTGMRKIDRAALRRIAMRD